MRPVEIVRTCREKGIDRLAVTDHNTLRGALEMRAIAPELVIVGEEIMTTQGELLAYFVKEEIPRGLSPVETINRLRAQSAAISVSHPFDRLRHGAWREPDLAAILPLVDAIEVFNARCIYPADNDRALAFARANAKLGTVGSDAHWYSEFGCAALRVPQAPASGAEFVAALGVAESVTRLSSPVIHLTSTFAKVWKKVERLVGSDRPGLKKT